MVEFLLIAEDVLNVVCVNSSALKRRLRLGDCVRGTMQNNTIVLKAAAFSRTPEKYKTDGIMAVCFCADIIPYEGIFDFTEHFSLT